MTVPKVLLFCLGCVLFDVLAARLLDSLGLVEGLLSPNGAQLLLLVPLACAFYAARIITYFVLPALVFSALVFSPKCTQRG